MTLKEYEIISKLGAGSFGIVYKARQKNQKDHLCVIKEIQISKLDLRLKKWAMNQAKIMKDLNSPYIIKYERSFVQKTKLYIVMEYCSKGDLAKFIKAQMGKPIKQQIIWKFAIQIMIGLRDLHSKKILHRDIKTLNIFLDDCFNVRVGDLGVAKTLNYAQNFTNTIVGTPYYLSPQMCEEKPYNQKTDVWAFGCLIYQLCTFRHPFEAQNQAALALKIVMGKYSQIPSNYSKDLKSLIQLCLSVDYQRRPTINNLLSKPRVIDQISKLKIQLYLPQLKTQNNKMYQQKNNQVKYVLEKNDHQIPKQQIVQNQQQIKNNVNCRSKVNGKYNNDKSNIPVSKCQQSNERRIYQQKSKNIKIIKNQILIKQTQQKYKQKGKQKQKLKIQEQYKQKIQQKYKQKKQISINQQMLRKKRDQQQKLKVFRDQKQKLKLINIGPAQINIENRKPLQQKQIIKQQKISKQRFQGKKVYSSNKNKKIVQSLNKNIQFKKINPHQNLNNLQIKERRQKINEEDNLNIIKQQNQDFKKFAQLNYKNQLKSTESSQKMKKCNEKMIKQAHFVQSKIQQQVDDQLLLAQFGITPQKKNQLENKLVIKIKNIDWKTNVNKIQYQHKKNQQVNIQDRIQSGNNIKNYSQINSSKLQQLPVIKSHDQNKIKNHQNKLNYIDISNQNLIINKSADLGAHIYQDIGELLDDNQPFQDVNSDDQQFSLSFQATNSNNLFGQSPQLIIMEKIQAQIEQNRTNSIQKSIQLYASKKQQNEKRCIHLQTLRVHTQKQYFSHLPKILFEGIKSQLSNEINLNDKEVDKLMKQLTQGKQKLAIKFFKIISFEMQIQLCKKNISECNLKIRQLISQQHVI